MLVVLSGFVVAIGLIVSIGAQNAWVLGMSIRGHYPWTIAVICFTIDALLMAIGVVFLQSLQQLIPSLVTWMSLLGIAILLFLAVQAFYRAATLRSGLTANSVGAVKTRRQVAVTAMAISLLNPHVYLDTVLLIGGIASVQPNPWLFWTGSALASVVWFSSLAALGKPLSRWLNSAKRWQLFEVIIGLIMLWVAASLAVYVLR